MHALTQLEIASGLVLGSVPVRQAATGAQAIVVLEDAIRPALLRPPCLVSFSGGRDSSAVLALAASLARREGHGLPIPVTNRFTGIANADESDWQERVIRHLALPDWIVIDHDDELDLVGPIATSSLRQHGLLWPFNAYFHVPLLCRARGGSLLTGLGGDEMLMASRHADSLQLVRRAWRIRRTDALHLALTVAPRRVRAASARRGAPPHFVWLREAARAELGRGVAAQTASEPFRWAPHVRWRAGLRYLVVAAASLEALAADDDVQVTHPFLDGTVALAIAALPPRRRFADRSVAMRRLFGGLLPEDVLTRRSKACFDEVFWNCHARRFAASWDGSGVDEAVVDAGALREMWRGGSPSPLSFLLLQSLYLRTLPPSADCRLRPAATRGSSAA
jgi:asparagine synthetase B (glutamine-hydrolysing)